MKEAISLQAIETSVKGNLSTKIISKRVPDIKIDHDHDRIMGLAKGFGHEESEISWKTVGSRDYRKSMIVVIVFCLPESKIAKDEILPHLEYLNESTSDFVHFYFPGYGSGWPAHYYPDQKKVGTLNGVDWFFSVKPFNSIRKDLEAKTKWRYSSETDLILLSGKQNSAESGELCFSPSHTCNLELMAKDGAFTSVRSFFGQITRLAESNNSNDPIRFLSNRYGGKIGMDFLKSALLSLLPDELAKSYRKAEHFAIKDISK